MGLALAATLAFAALAACGDSEAPAQGPPPGPRPALVKVDVVRDGALTDSARYLGQVQPVHEATIAAGVSGHVRDVSGREGDLVALGDLLVTLDTDLIDPRLDAVHAETARVAADLEQARRELDRAAKLPHPVVTAAERERYEARVASLRAQLRAARATARQIAAEQERHAVRAPFAGAIVARHVDPGAWVSPGVPLLDLVSVDDVEVHVDLPPLLRRQVEVGGAAKLLGEPPVAARVGGIVPSLDPQTRTMRVRLVPEGAPPPWLVPNAPVEVEFELRVAGEGVLVSRDALVRGPVNVRVIAVREGQAVPVEVEVLGTSGGDALVRGEGLAVGDTVVVRGNDRLRPGQPIQVIE